MLENSLKKFERLGELFDYYGVLLTPKECLIAEKFLYEGLSISEISKELSCSRQGVYDMLQRIEKKLQNFEIKLRLISKERKIIDSLTEFKTYLPDEFRKKIEEILFSPGGD